MGNPGKDYASTRHNIGKMVVEELAGNAVPVPLTLGSHKKTNTDLAQLRLPGANGQSISVIAAAPRSFMNLSGGPTANVARFFNVAPTNVIVVHDELDIDFGSIRLKRGGGEGGHNGLRDISKALGTKDYLRVRVGIGRPPGRMSPADYVLRPFSGSEASELPIVIADAADAVELLIRSGLEAAQNAVHTKQ